MTDPSPHVGSADASRRSEETRCKPSCVIDGEPWWNFCFEYDWEGKTYGFDICARSQEEAEARLMRLPLARYVGQMDGKPIPITHGGFLVPLIVWWRNWRNV
jgi:hypothetical protein